MKEEKSEKKIFFYLEYINTKVYSMLCPYLLLCSLKNEIYDSIKSWSSTTRTFTIARVSVK